MQALTRVARPALMRTSLPIRTFTTLSPIRPSLFANTLRRPTALTSFAPAPTAPSGVTADVVAPSAITAHPALAGGVSQIRCGPRNTMVRATRLVQKRRHGFLSRMRTRTGRAIIKRRRAKGRRRLGC